MVDQPPDPTTSGKWYSTLTTPAWVTTIVVIVGVAINLTRTPVDRATLDHQTAEIKGLAVEIQSLKADQREANLRLSELYRVRVELTEANRSLAELKARPALR